MGLGLVLEAGLGLRLRLRSGSGSGLRLGVGLRLGLRFRLEIGYGFGFEEGMIVREAHNDISFLRFYLDEEFMREQNYFSYSFKKDQKATTIDEVSNNDGWESVRDDMINNIGLNRAARLYGNYFKNRSD